MLARLRRGSDLHSTVLSGNRAVTCNSPPRARTYRRSVLRFMSSRRSIFEIVGWRTSSFLLGDVAAWSESHRYSSGRDVERLGVLAADRLDE